MTDPATNAAELLRLLAKEGRRRVLSLAAVFSVVALSALGVGLLVPRQYEAQTTLLVESKNVIAPLMAGRAQTAGSEDAQLVRQAFLTRRVLREILAVAGLGEPKSPIQESRMLARVARQVTIQSPRRELIRIAYRDSDPQRSLTVTNKLAEIYIRESTVGTERQSRDAFDFIDKQVKEYATKVEDAHARVLEYERELERRGKPARRPAAPVRKAGAGLSPEQLAALSVEESTLSAELAASDARTGRARRAERTAQLERELETLLTTLTENHPNVKRAREELRLQRLEAERAGATDDAATAAVRTRLEQVRRQLASAGVAAATVPAPVQLAPDIDPELRGVGQDSTLSELVRRYEAARRVYQDLLERRENARVSMELETDRDNARIRIYEPAELPVIPVGLRLMHFALLGLVLGTAAPLGLLIALLRLDPRVRSARQLEVASSVPLLVGIPYAPSRRERLRQRRDALLAAAVVCGVFAAYAGTFLVRLRLSS